jgi:hypothetical protein
MVRFVPTHAFAAGIGRKHRLEAARSCNENRPSFTTNVIVERRFEVDIRGALPENMRRRLRALKDSGSSRVVPPLLWIALGGSVILYGIHTVPQDCTTGSVRSNGVCVGQGLLRVTLSWTALSDFDLHVRTPAGHEVFYSNRTADGGKLDVDDCRGGTCLNPNKHVENIFFATEAPPGEYEAWVVNYDGAAGGDFTIEVNGGFAVPLFTGSLTNKSGAESAHFRFRH